MGPTEYFLLALVIVVPLAIAGGVTLWSLEQVRYRPKQRRPRPNPASDTPNGPAPTRPSGEEDGRPGEAASFDRATPS